MPSVINPTAERPDPRGFRGLRDAIVDARGDWVGRRERCRDDLLHLSRPEDEVTISGPVDLDVAVYADHALEGPGGREITRSLVTTYPVHVPRGRTWSNRLADLRGQGGNAGSSVMIRPARPRPEVRVGVGRGLPDDLAVRPIDDLGRFFPEPCEPCEGGPVHVPPGVCGPAVDVHPAGGGCVRPRFFDGMLISATDLEAQLQYVRTKLRLHNRATGSGVVWGFDVALRGEHIVVGPGYGIDTCGNDLTVTCDYQVPAADLLTDPAFCREQQHHCYLLLLEYVECAQSPRPVHGDGCAPRDAGCEMSRVRETVRLRLVPRQHPTPTPLARFLERVDALVGEPEPEGREPEGFAVPGAAPVPSDPSVTVPWRLRTTMGATTTIEPSRTETRTATIRDVPGEGEAELRLIPFPDVPGLRGTVRRDDGTVDATITTGGTVWVAPYGKQSSRSWTVSWETGGLRPLRGTTPVDVQVRGGEVLEGVVQDPAGDRVYLLFPASDALAEGVLVAVERPDDTGNTWMLPILEVRDEDGDQVQVVAALAEGQRVEQGARAFVNEPYELTTIVGPTEVQELPRDPVATPCCEPGCCSDLEDLALEDRLRVLLLALLYGRLLQRTSAIGRAVGRSATTAGTLASLRRLLKVRREDLPALEDATTDLYRAWCAAGIYAGPEIADPDGAVIGCTTVENGAICAVDPLDGRRWVVHQPLLDHWSAQFGLDPLDLRIGQLYQRLCCLSHLPTFGRLLARPPEGVGEEQPPSGEAVRVTSLPRAETRPTGATTGLLGALSQVSELDVSAVARLVDDVLCREGGPLRVTLPPKTAVRADKVAGDAVLGLDTLPAQPVRRLAKPLVRAALAGVPLEVVTSESPALREALEGLDVRTVDDLIAVDPDDLAEAVALTSRREEVDDALAAARNLVGRIAEQVTRAMTTLRRDDKLETPEEIEDEDIRETLVTEIGDGLEREAITFDLEAIRDATRRVRPPS